MKMIVTLALGSVLLASCSGGLETKARKALAGQLKDVESAQFRNLTESKPASTGGGRMICGEVKTKNGGDFTRFMVESSGKSEAVIANDTVSSAVLGALVDTACKDGSS